MQVARKLTHYIAPDVCDEVAHCMHHFKKDMKHSLANRISGVIEDNIKKAFEEHAIHLNGENSEAAASAKEAKGKRGMLFYILYSFRTHIDNSRNAEVFNPVYNFALL